MVSFFRWLTHLPSSVPYIKPETPYVRRLQTFFRQCVTPREGAYAEFSGSSESEHGCQLLGWPSESSLLLVTASTLCLELRL